MDLLAKYTAIAKTMSIGSLYYAIVDVKATLKLWDHEPPNHPYVAKLLAELDAYEVEAYRRRNPVKRYR